MHYVYPYFIMRTLRHGSMKEHAKRYIANRWWCWDMSLCSLALGPMPLTIICAAIS